MDEGQLRNEIFSRIKEIYKLRKAGMKFVPGKTKVHYSGRVYDEEEMIAVTDAVLDFYLTFGERGLNFEREFAKFNRVRHAVLVNSGSSANLVAVSTLCSKNLKNHLKPRDEVITPAVTFPTTLNPIIQNGLFPVFVDIDLGTYNINVELMKEAATKKTKAMVIPHSLGNPNDMKEVMNFADKRGLFVIEDACDALGSKFDGKLCGTFGNMGTFSFYPAHHMTMGEGGAIITNNDSMAKIARSIRDWGKDCFCKTGDTNLNGACGNRFNFKVDGLAYDHKYIYSNIGYNLKALDIQAAMGLVQLKKMPQFEKARKKNFKLLYSILEKYDEFFMLPRWLDGTDPSWFSFPITIRGDAPFRREEIIRYLENKQIETRLLFAGNILKQPAYRGIKYRIHKKLTNSDIVMKNTFFIGVYPGINDDVIKYMESCFRGFLSKFKG
jgi:CDP-6-deoxy-D-xylo-4-hexulose-3-dehydrase